MRFLERRRRGLWTDDGDRKRFYSRSILVTDVDDAKQQLDKVCDRVDVVRWLPRHDEASGPALGLENVSDADLAGICVQGWIDECTQPVVRLRLGSQSPAYIETRRVFLKESALGHGKIAEIEDGSSQAAFIIARAGRAILSPSQWTVLLKAAVWLVLGALYVWYARTAWPSIPALLVGALAVISAGVLAWQRLRRSMDRRFADLPERIIVNHMTRDQWRERRWSAKRDIWVAAISFAVTAAVTVVATYVAIELTGAR
jgi:hypothetical protein